MKPKLSSNVSLLCAVLALAIMACSLTTSISPTSTAQPASVNTDTPVSAQALTSTATSVPATANISTPVAYPAPVSKATSAPTLAPTATLTPTEPALPSPTATILRAPSATPQATGAITGTLAAGEAKAIFLAALAKLQMSYPFQVTETGNAMSGDGTDSTRVVEMAAADQTHEAITSSIQIVAEEIVIGKKVYIKVAKNPWKAGTQSNIDVIKIATVLSTDVTGVQPAGLVTLDGVDTMSYSFTVSYAGANITGNIWIGTVDGLPHQIEMSVVAQGVSLTEKQVYKYGIKVTIQAPMP